MLRTHLVISTALGLLSALSQENRVAGATRTLDLTKSPLSERRSFGVPGSSGGGIGGQTPATSLYDLPITVKLLELRSVPGSQYGVLRIEIENVGKSVIQIPACLDAYAEFVPRAHNRRSLNFGLTVESASTREHSWEFVEVTSGSDSVQNCLAPIAAGSTLVVVMNAELPNIAVTQSNAGGDQSLFRAFVEEWKFEDARYVISMRSKRVDSNAVQDFTRKLLSAIDYFAISR